VPERSQLGIKLIKLQVTHAWKVTSRGLNLINLQVASYKLQVNN